MQDGDPLGAVADELGQLAQELVADEDLVRVGARGACDLDAGGSLLRHAGVLHAGGGFALRQFQCVDDRLGDLFGGVLVGRNDGTGDLFVEVTAGVHQLAPLPARVDREQRAGGAETDAADGLVTSMER